MALGESGHRPSESVAKLCLTLGPHGLARRAPLSVEFSRHEHRSGLPFPSPGYLPDPGIEPQSPVMQAVFTHWVTSEAPRILESVTLDSSDDKGPACNAGDLGTTRGSGRSPGEGNGNPLQCSCLENSTDRGAWRATVHGVPESDTT